jgi:hypothetical protein
MAVHRHHLTDFNAPPPRAVPLSLRLVVLFGGSRNQFGWMLLGFGLIFVWAFTLHADFTSPLLFLMGTRETRGVVRAVRASNASENEQRIYEIHYAYIDHLGRQHLGVSYATHSPQQGADVTVEYLSSAPEISRVEGMRRKPFGFFAAFPILFPMIGLGFLSSGLRHGLKADRLLAQGRVAFGELTSTVPTGASVNNRPVMKLTYNFTAADGEEWEATAESHEVDDLTDEAQEPLLYDPEDPSRAVLLDDLPGSARFDSAGRLLSASPVRVVRALLFPALTLMGHGGYMLVRLMG